MGRGRGVRGRNADEWREGWGSERGGGRARARKREEGKRVLIEDGGDRG